MMSHAERRLRSAIEFAVRDKATPIACRNLLLEFHHHLAYVAAAQRLEHRWTDDMVLISLTPLGCLCVTRVTAAGDRLVCSDWDVTLPANFVLALEATA